MKPGERLLYRAMGEHISKQSLSDGAAEVETTCQTNQQKRGAARNCCINSTAVRSARTIPPEGTNHGPISPHSVPVSTLYVALCRDWHHRLEPKRATKVGVVGQQETRQQ